MAGTPHHAPHSAVRIGILEISPKTRQRILCILAAARIWIDRRVLRFRLIPVFRFLGSLVGPDVLPDRSLGARTANLRCRVKFFVYTMAGSMLMLIGIIYLYNQAGTFDYAKILAGLQNGSIASTYQEQLLLFLAFFIAFAIKVPLFPPAHLAAGCARGKRLPPVP